MIFISPKLIGDIPKKIIVAKLERIKDDTIHHIKGALDAYTKYKKRHGGEKRLGELKTHFLYN